MIKIDNKWQRVNKSVHEYFRKSFREEVSEESFNVQVFLERKGKKNKTFFVVPREGESSTKSLWIKLFFSYLLRMGDPNGAASCCYREQRISLIPIYYYYCCRPPMRCFIYKKTYWSGTINSKNSRWNCIQTGREYRLVTIARCGWEEGDAYVAENYSPFRFLSFQFSSSLRIFASSP